MLAEKLPASYDSVQTSEMLCPNLTEELLHNAVHDAYTHFGSQVSPLEPKSSLGTTMYNKVTGLLRASLLREAGWESLDVSNVCLAVNNEYGVAVACCSGSEGVGISAAPVVTRCSKGRTTARLVNGQMQLFDDSEYITVQTGAEILLGCKVWYLLTYVDRNNNQLRFELSLPKNIVEGQPIRDWQERIIFNHIELSEYPTIWSNSAESHEDAQLVDIPVTLKKAI